MSSARSAGRAGAPTATFPVGYRPLNLLARGEEFETYDAWSEKRFSRCVVKTVRRDRNTSVNRRRIGREGGILTSSDHPHLVRGYEVGVLPCPYLVMETLTGSTLRALIRQMRAPWGSDDIVELAVQAGSALRYLHARGVLHLDVKPDNIIVDAGRIKLFDLSLARSSGPSQAGRGTPGYMAPEQVDGGVVDGRTDVHGMGVLMYELAMGRVPTRRRSLPRGLPVGLSSVILGALEPVAADRPTMGELHERMLALADRHPTG